MEATGKLFIDALKCALHGNRAEWDHIPDEAEWSGVCRLAREHHVLPLLAESLNGTPAAVERPKRWELFLDYAREQTLTQACRTAEFKLLYSRLAREGLHPAIVKGIICRRMYPHPNQRVSWDEDLFIPEDEFDACAAALEGYGLAREYTDTPEDVLYETTFKDMSRHLYIEIHTRLFPPAYAAYGDCSAPFVDALERSSEITIDGMAFRTLDPTDHLLYLMLHAYKHFLHGGMGIRHVCDICLFAGTEETDGRRIRSVTDGLRLSRLFAAVFAIGERYLGLKGYPAFADIDAEPEPLLEDILTGGLYGTVDIDRAHSSRITLEAAAAEKSGRRSRGALTSAFPSRRALEGTYPTLKKHPYLLPVFWIRRLFAYLTDRRQGPIDPTRSLKIGSERVALLENYGVIGGRRRGRRR
ncbi:MAG: nucleotidyltransferase family protein [Clostridia bacterium]|nr:nucleotidyltransferase family protein [Clostridia bacterium]MBQ4341230.1 nucleotidyltransferase family protein [Clostridia bacterium]